MVERYKSHYICHTHKYMTASTFWFTNHAYLMWRHDWAKVQATDETTQRFLDDYGFTASERDRLEAMKGGH